MSEISKLIAEIKSEGILRAGNKLEQLYSMAEQMEKEYTAFQQKLDAMAAENAAQSSSLKALATLNNRLWQWTSRMSYNASYVGEPDGLVKCHIREMEKILDGAANKTPATDSYLKSVRAEGADKVAEYHFVRIDVLKELSRQGHLFHKAAYADAVNVADQLRSGTHDTADKAG